MWIRTCTNPDNNPGCLKLINYKTTIGLNNGNRINSVCHSCRNYKPKNHIRFIRICFRCGNEINYGGIYAYKNAEKNETLCNKCTFHEKLAKNLHSKDVAKKISDSLKGNKPWNTGLKGVQVPWNKGLTIEKDSRLLHYWRGKHRSPETIQKMCDGRKRHFELHLG